MRAVLLLLTACNQVFGIEKTDVVELYADDDDDGARNLDDNCRSVANADQRDLDRDGLGDVCDNCPLAANTPQEAIGDTDSFGDVCDPNPDRDGDCLIVYDTFSAPERFAEHWLAPAAAIEHVDGHIRVTATSRVALFVRGGDGAPLTGQYAVDLLVDVPSPQAGGRIAAVSTSDTTNGRWCSLLTPPDLKTPGRVSSGDADDAAPIIRMMSTGPFGTLASLRLRSVVDAQSVEIVHCRASYNIALGVAYAPAIAPFGTGSGLVVENLTADVYGIVISSYQASSSCPEPILR